MKARVRVIVIEEKKPFPGIGVRGGAGKAGAEGKKRYVTRQLTVEELAGIPPREKERQGFVIQELSVSKLALTAL